MHTIVGQNVRFPVEPRDVPAAKAARRLHLTSKEFDEIKADLFKRGFPRPDPTTGMYDLRKIDQWMDARDAGCTDPRENGVLDPREIMRRRGWGSDDD
jgi:hypothetical protein